MIWNSEKGELSSGKRSVVLPRSQARLFDLLWNAGGNAIFRSELSKKCGVKRLSGCHFDELSNKLTPFGMRIESDHSCGIWLEHNR